MSLRVLLDRWASRWRLRRFYDAAVSVRAQRLFCFLFSFKGQSSLAARAKWFTVVSLVFLRFVLASMLRLLSTREFSEVLSDFD